MMVEGFKMNVVYFDPYPNAYMENYVKAYGAFLASQGDAPVTCRRLDTVEDVLKVADVVSLHPPVGRYDLPFDECRATVLDEGQCHFDQCQPRGRLSTRSHWSNTAKPIPIPSWARRV